jgi:hypothetical protein
MVHALTFVGCSLIARLLAGGRAHAKAEAGIAGESDPESRS